jgi:hypothetical protein
MLAHPSAARHRAVAIRSESLGKETEVVREGHACRKNFFKAKIL